MDHPPRSVFALLALIAAASAAAEPASSADWPTYRADNRRSGVTPEPLRLPLAPVWTYTAPTPPQMAWTGPAKWDAYANLRRLESMRNFDTAFFVTTVGDSVCFGSSVDDAVHCLDVETGTEKWVFPAGGPVRLPPSWHEGRVYFGSDDGHAYCVDAATGSLVWKRKPSGAETLMLSNGKLISHWPCRTGVLIHDSLAYYGASLLPWEKSYLCAVDARSGDEEGPGCYCVTFEHLTMQGAILATESRLYLPQGRQRPELFDRATGRSLGGVGGAGQGGVFAVVTRTGEFVSGHGQNHGSGGELRGFDADSRDYFVTFPEARQIVVTDEVAYLNMGREIGGFDRARYMELAKRQTQLQSRRKAIQEQLAQLSEPSRGPAGEDLREELKPIESELAASPSKMAACYTWKTTGDCPHDLILAGNTLFAGGDDRVVAFDAASGKELGSVPVTGRAYGLVAANGRLFASTDRGTIHCFKAAVDQ